MMRLVLCRCMYTQFRRPLNSDRELVKVMALFRSENLFAKSEAATGSGSCTSTATAAGAMEKIC